MRPDRWVHVGLVLGSLDQVDRREQANDHQAKDGHIGFHFLGIYRHLGLQKLRVLSILRDLQVYGAGAMSFFRHGQQRISPRRTRRTRRTQRASILSAVGGSAFDPEWSALGMADGQKGLAGDLWKRGFHRGKR